MKVSTKDYLFPTLLAFDDIDTVYPTVTINIILFDGGPICGLAGGA